MSMNQPMTSQELKTTLAETSNMVSMSQAWALECTQ